MYVKQNTDEGKALLNFRDEQSEVILEAPLLREEIVALSGIASAFDDLCAQAGVGDEDARDQAFKRLIDQNIYPTEPGWINEVAAQRAVQKTISAFVQKIEGLNKSAK